MSSETASALSSLWFTYVVQSAAGYMLLWLLCRFVRDPKFRFWLWGVFLGGMVAAWLGLLPLSRLSASGASVSAAFPGVAETHWSWALNFDFTPYFSTILSGLCWTYLAILALSLLSFCARFWQLKTLLRTSQPPSDSLLSLFESVRTGVQAPHCELRLVPRLGSPAAAGWRHPQILLPNEYLSRLETPQLMGILKHELMHVRRRDYLWDRLATVGCYLVFFHPAAWLVRRHLRWDRELICDEASADRSDACRLDYAACLTTLASWRLSGEGFAGPIDFLSSPSLLSTRVRAMVSPPNLDYSANKKAAFACLAAVSLFLAIRLVPEATFTPSPTLSAIALPPQTADSIPESPHRPQPVSYAEPKRVLQRHMSTVSKAKVRHIQSQFASSVPKIPGGLLSVSGSSRPQTQPEPKRRPALWRFIPKFGGWAIHSVKAGFSKVGSQLAGNRPQKDQS
ncbi:M56 family metallopeptidase [Alloacidobacterium sp.]|uniref:M56 family metallopeptidase n=1 Tax=Alloacidobacterium sp. TaxID=2951999 RepID=UPI002D4CA9F0|nr:M56 family metallopeptidase [Alloacidobacterium sp.]HYK34315.1 M56 family metallopeptidase [Alloacidobacterium sp.]